MSAGEPRAHRPDTSGERTDLAWNRSGLALLACGAAILKGLGGPPLPPADVVVGSVVFALGVAIWALGAWHGQRRARLAPAPPTVSDLAPVAFGVALVGIAALVVAAVAPG